MNNSIKFIIISIIIMGCYPGDEYILSHTTEIKVVSSGEFEIELRVEDTADVYSANATTDDLLLAQELMYESVFPPLESLRSVVVFIPGSMDSWSSYRSNYKTSLPPEKVDASHCGKTELGNFLVIFNPEKWRKLKTRQLVATYIHELTHHVSIRLTGKSDPTHSNSVLWRKHGFENDVFEKWIFETTAEQNSVQLP